MDQADGMAQMDKKPSHALACSQAGSIKSIQSISSIQSIIPAPHPPKEKGLKAV